MYKEELGKFISGKVFYAAILAVLVLLMAGTVYVDSLTGQEYSLAEVLFSSQSSRMIKEFALTGGEIIIGGTEGYLGLFMPVIAIMPFVQVICTEKKNSNARFEIMRVGKNRYVFGKFFAALTAGGLIAATGYLIMTIILLVRMGPGDVQADLAIIQGHNALYAFLINHLGFAGIILIKLVRMFLYGTYSVAIAFAMTVMVKNKYVVLSVPYIVTYFWEKGIDRMSDDNLYALKPVSLMYIIHKNMLLGILFVVIVTIVSVTIYRRVLESIVDCGEM